MSPKQMFSDREYLENQIKGLTDKIDDLRDIVVENIKKQEERFKIQEEENKAQNVEISAIKTDIQSAKLLGKAAMGITLAIGGFVSWVVSIIPKGFFYHGQ
jgi:hypothetical protein